MYSVGPMKPTKKIPDYLPTLKELVLFRQGKLTEEDCLKATIHKLHGDNPVCPVCGGKASIKLYTAAVGTRAWVIQCTTHSCRIHRGIFKGTIYEATKRLEFLKIYQIIYWVYVTRGRVSAETLRQRSGFSINTARVYRNKVIDALGLPAELKMERNVRKA